jgi:hypothetical protein
VCELHSQGEARQASPGGVLVNRKAHLADSVALAFVGWCLFFTTGYRVVQGRGWSERTLLLLLFVVSCAVLGYFLSSLLSPLMKRGAPGRVAVWVVRLLAAGAVGKYVLPKFADGCSSGLAVLCFGVLLFLVLRSLDDSGESLLVPSQSPQREDSAAGRVSGEPQGRGRAVLASRVSGKLQQLFAMAASGVVTGFLAGAARAALGMEELGEKTSVFCLFPISVIVLGVLVRLLCARLIQGRRQVAGWKVGLTIADGLIVGTLLAVVTAGKLPQAVWWNGTLSRSQLPWVLYGVVLGLTWGVIFGSFKAMVSQALRFRLRSAIPTHEGGAAAELETSRPVAAPSGGGNQESSGLRSEGLAAASATIAPRSTDQDEREAPPVASRTSAAPRFACSCLAAIAALGGMLFFSFLASKGIFQFESPRSDVARLPKGCPPHCAGAALDRFELAGADFSNADLSEAKLRDAVLEGASFRGATLKGALLFQAKLGKAVLSGADLSGADLRNTILLEAQLENTRLRGAYLRYATLQDLDLSTADLQGADLRNAVYTRKTKWPPGFDVAKAGLRLDE